MPDTDDASTSSRSIGWYVDPEAPSQQRYWDGGQWTRRRPNAPVGWYQDPEASERQRFWDGSRWTEQRRAWGEATPGTERPETPPPKEKEAPEARPRSRRRLLIAGGAGCAAGLILGGIVSLVGPTASDKADLDREATKQAIERAGLTHTSTATQTTRPTTTVEAVKTVGAR